MSKETEVADQQDKRQRGWRQSCMLLCERQRDENEEEEEEAD